ncbi:hypothetical protein JYT94_00655, partial [bacterium AH-315-P11]|nr:hypothetical protein [bacterium AH-315-P11]
GEATKLIISLKDEARAFAGTFVNIGESFKGWKAVFSGRLSFFEFATMDAKEFDEWLKKNSKNVAVLATETNKANTSIKNNAVENSKDQEKASDDLAKSQKDLVAAAKKEASEKTAITKEMYEQLGQGGEAYFSAEASELVKKAAKWKEAGADVIAIEDWLYDQIGALSEQAWEKEESAAGMAMDNLQSQAGALVDELNTVTGAGMDMLEQYGLQIEGLDGTAFTVYASMDGSGMESTVNSLIAQFQQLNAVAAAAPSPGGASPSNNSGEETTDEWAERIRNAPDNYNTSTTVNINQQVSRSDVNAIISEQNRQEVRS